MPMSMMTVLLLIIMILLVAVIILMFTLWPRRQRAEIEKAVSALRREMAEHRGDSIRLMQAIRNEVEEAVQEVLEHELNDYFRRGAPGRTSFRRPATTSSDAGSAKKGRMGPGESDTAPPDGKSANQQMFLFQQPVEPQPPPLPESPEEPKQQVADRKEADPEPMEKVHAVLHDDIPDIDDLPDIEDVR